MDFGIAKLLTVDVNMTRTGTQMGTPTYMSPEQVRDVRDIDRRSDIYSLGVTLYFMMSGAAPYNTSTLSTFDIYNKIVHEPLPPLSAAIQFNNIVAKATAKKPEDRYSTCDAMAADFKPDNEKPKPVVSEDDEKTLIFTDTPKPSDKKTQPVPAQKVATSAPKPSKVESPPPKAEQKPPIQEAKSKPKAKPEEQEKEQNRKKFSKKSKIMAGAGAFIVVLLVAFYLIGTSDDIVVLSDSNDSLSYSLGVVEGHYLTQKFDTVNLPALKKGIMKATRYDAPSLPDQRVMFKYSKNNLKNYTFNKEEYSSFFEKYGVFLYSFRSKDLIFDLDNKLFWSGIKHVVSGKTPEISFKDAAKYSSNYPGIDMKFQNQDKIEEEKRFFADLARKSNIRKAENGVYYEVLSEGFSYESTPSENDILTLSITIKNLNNQELFRDERKVVTVGTVFPGLKTVLLKMKKGANYRVYVPSDQAYGSFGVGDEIPPYQALICDIYWPDSPL